MRARACSKSAFVNGRTIPRVYRSELEPLGRTQVIEDRPIGGRETPTAQPRVCDDQAIERIARPGFFGRRTEPAQCGWLVDTPPRILEYVPERRFQLQPPRFEDELPLEHRGGRHSEGR